MKKDTRLILAMDVSCGEQALSLAHLLEGCYDAIKIGYPLILSAGIGIIKEISVNASVIADLKIADIPNTNRLICEEVLEKGASGVIAHAFPGRDSLQACADCVKDYGADLFVVTEMSHPGAEQFLGPAARDLAQIAVLVDAAGVVAPATRPERIKLIRSVIGDRIIISPGVGAQGGSALSAILAGADYLIVGRSIIHADNPREKAESIISEII
jgi:orotidine-5'-phosphate decarboxylase